MARSPLLDECRAFHAIPLAARAWTFLLVLAAAVLPVATGGRPTPGDALLALVLVLLAGLNVELGRRAEGGKLVLRQRPHKALSAWPFALALLAPATLLPLVVLVAYAWTRRRGMRVPLWKWWGSGATLVLAGCAVSQRTGGASLEPVQVGVAALVFLGVEVLLLAVCSRVNDSQDEAWLRGQLASRSFHLNEAGVLLCGAAVAVLWQAAPAFVLLAVPLFGAVQRALLLEPLRTEAETDEKTGLLHYNAWRAAAQVLTARDAGAAVVFADLDHFKAVNDTHGHLVGDEVLAEVAARLVQALRGDDVAGRFGGEEFCVVLPGVGEHEARAVAERIRRAVRDVPVRGFGVTVSVGVGVAVRGTSPGLDALMAAADRAVYAAKDRGRDATHVELVGVLPRPRRAEGVAARSR